MQDVHPGVTTDDRSYFLLNQIIFSDQDPGWSSPIKAQCVLQE